MKMILKILRLTMSTIVFMATLELLARLDDYFTYSAPLLSVYSSDNLYTTDNLGVKGRPNVCFRKWHMNSIGYRGPEVTPGSVPVLCIGASETFGLYESEDHEFPRELERILNQQSGFEKYSVVNVGLPGEMIRSSNLRVPEYVKNLHPQYAFIYPSVAGYIELTNSLPPGMRGRSANLEPKKFQLRMAERMFNLFKSLIPMLWQNQLRGYAIARSVRYNPDYSGASLAVEKFRLDVAALIAPLKAHGVQLILMRHGTFLGTRKRSQAKYGLARGLMCCTFPEDAILDVEGKRKSDLRSLLP